MADPPVPPQPLDPAVAQSYDDFSISASRAQASMTSLEGVFGSTHSALRLLSEGFVATGGKLENIGNLTTQDAAKFGALTTAVLGAKEAFTSLNNVDTGRLSTFAGQVQEMEATFQRSPAFKTAKKIYDDAIDAARRFIAMKPGDKMQESMGAAMIRDAEKAFKDAAGGISDTAKAMLLSADNALRLQNAMFQLTAQAGDSASMFGQISDSMAGVGDDLSNLNAVTAKYQDVMFDAMQATGIESEEVMAQYMATINKMPGGFKELMGSMELAGRSTNILTATIQYATGAGRNISEVLDDMKHAAASYGMSLQDSLKFTSNVTTVSNTLHAQIEDVRSALMGSADAFKVFAIGEDGARKMTQGMTESMNQYVSSLTNVGVPVQNALNMFKNYTEQMKNMNQAQQAFISGMTGGPGGLMGGFQMDAMIKRGDFAGLQKKVEETIRKMTGPIVSFEDAQKSQTAAAQYTKQLQILQQGPLGGMAKTRGEAESLLESMRVGKVAEKAKTPEETLAETVEKGAKIEQLSYTELKEINLSTKRMAAQAGLANLTTIQRGFAARTGAAGGVDDQGRAINTANQEALRATQGRGMAPTEGSPTEKALKELGITITSLPMSIQSSMKALRESVASGNKESMAQAQDRLNKSIEDWKAQAAKLPDEQRKAAERIIAGVQTAANREVQTGVGRAQNLFRLPQTTATGTTPPPGTNVPGVTGRTPVAPPPPPGDFRPAFRQVGAAVTPPTGGGGTGATGTQGRAGAGVTPGPNTPMPVTLAPGTNITVNFTGVCPHCGKGVHQSNQAAITNNAPSTALNQ